MYLCVDEAELAKTLVCVQDGLFRFKVFQIKVHLRIRGWPCLNVVTTKRIVY